MHKISDHCLIAICPPLLSQYEVIMQCSEKFTLLNNATFKGTSGIANGSALATRNATSILVIDPLLGASSIPSTWHISGYKSMLFAIDRTYKFNSKYPC